MLVPSQLGIPGDISVFSSYLLTKQLISIFSTDLTGLWLGQDLITDGNNNITSWPGRVGPTLVNGTSMLFQSTSLNGRQAMSSSVSVVRYLIGTLTAPALSIWSVAVIPSLPFSDFLSLALVANTSLAIIGTSGANTLYTGQGWTHNVDGVSTEIVTSGIHILEGHITTNTFSSIIVGDHMSIASRAWITPIGFLMTLSRIPSTVQRSIAVSAIARYQRIL
jgi:hypothetical protein